MLGAYWRFCLRYIKYLKWNCLAEFLVTVLRKSEHIFFAPSGLRCVSFEFYRAQLQGFANRAQTEVRIEHFAHKPPLYTRCHIMWMTWISQIT